MQEKIQLAIRVHYNIFTLCMLCLPMAIAQEGISRSASLESRQAVRELLLYHRSEKSGHFDFAVLQKLLLTAHPNDVTLLDIHKRVLWEESIICDRHRIEGVIFALRVDRHEGREVYSINTGGDSALYTGVYLAGLVLHYLATADQQTLEGIAQTVDGIYKLTHITGVPGMLARYAMPLREAERSGLIPAHKEGHNAWIHIYYSDPANFQLRYSHLSNLVAGENGVAPIAASPAARYLNPNHEYYGDTYYYTRTTRDQLTGIVFGLAIATYFLEDHNLKKYLPYYRMYPRHRELIEAIRRTTQETTIDVFHYLHTHQWQLQDHLVGESGTHANGIEGILKLAVQMLMRRVLMNSFPRQYHMEQEHFARLAPGIRQEIKRWEGNFRILKSYDENLLPPGLADIGEFIHLSSSAAWWQMTWNYYAWDLRCQRIFSILLLDDVNPEFYEVAPAEWPIHTLTQEEVNKRNCAWLAFWDRKIWRYLAYHGNPWFTYLYNFMRRIVLERHYGDRELERLSLGKSIYGLDEKECRRLFGSHDFQKYRRLKEVLFADAVEEGAVSNPGTLGLALPHAHFQLKSLAIAPIRTYSSPCLTVPALLRKSRSQKNLPTISPIHLITPRRFWIFAVDLRGDDPERSKKIDRTGSIETTMISMPTCYWLAYFSGQIYHQFDTYKRNYFITPSSQ